METQSEAKNFADALIQEESQQLQESIAKIVPILQTQMDSCDLPEEHFFYMSNMIIEDPPRTAEDLKAMLKDFMDNDPMMTPLKITQKCEAILSQLGSIIQSKTTSWAANRLSQPIVMEKVQLISDQEQESGYTETPFSFEVLRFHNDFIDPEKLAETQKLQKQKDRERRKKQDEYKRRQEEIEQLGNRIPPIKLLHNKEGGSIDIKVDSFNLEVSGKVLLEDTMLLMAAGHKYGLIGKNGIGKTTLLYKIVRKEIEKMNTRPQILMIEQEIIGTEKTPLELILETDGERTELLREEAELVNLSGSEGRLKEIYAKLDEIEASKAESKARALLNGLGFSEKMITEPTKILSGGWRMRVALAKVLFCSPDILLLDEPTNHLDLDAVMWLQDYLQTFPNTVLIVSHAREFLNSVCTDIIHIENQKLQYYRGGFEEFEQQREANLQRQARELEVQQNKIAHVQSFIDRFRYNAKKASLVQSRLKYLDKIEKVEKIISDDPNYAFAFNNPEQVRPPIIRIDDGSFSYNQGNNTLLEGLNFSVDMDSKVALLGANGVGKTTFLKILTGELMVNEGQYFMNKKARIGMFSQHHVDKLDLPLSPMEQFYKLYPDASNELVRKHLGQFGISGNLALRPIYLMSGGQKSRVSLALVAWTNPHILIMDEPTNHLDMEAVDALILALNSFNGGLVIVSHDQYFVSCVCEEIWYIRSKKLRKFNGDFEAYRNALATNRL